MKYFSRAASSISLCVLMLGFAHVHSVNAVSQFSTSLVSQPTKWSEEPSGNTETITKTAEGLVCQAGGEVSDTHYARIKYKLPEQAGMTFTSFYQKTVLTLPPDFYTKQVAYFRIMNTDNYGTTLQGTPVGATSADEFRTGVYLYSDHTLRIRSEHENNQSLEFYRGQLPVGDHTLELYGDVASVAPWWFKVDGVLVASGTARLSPDSVPVNERVITRLIGGIDGAASYDTSQVTLTLKDIVIANYDITASRMPMSELNTATPTRTPTPTTSRIPTATSVPTIVTATFTPTHVASSCPPRGLKRRGLASMNITINQAGKYKAWVQMKGNGDSANSIWLQWDDLYCVKVGDVRGMPRGTWTWVDYVNGNTTTKIPSLLIAAGTHTLTLIGNASEPGVAIDRVLLTKDTSCIPSGKGDACSGVVSTPIKFKSTPTGKPTGTPTVTKTPTMLPTAIPSPVSATYTPTPTMFQSGSIEQSLTAPIIQTTPRPNATHPLGILQQLWQLIRRLLSF